VVAIAALVVAYLGSVTAKKHPSRKQQSPQHTDL
jgi:hypothetical protein